MSAMRGGVDAPEDRDLEGDRCPSLVLCDNGGVKSGGGDGAGVK